MPKLKTRRSAAKRFKKSASGKIKRHHCNKSHILTKKSSKRKRHLRKATLISDADAPNVLRMLGGLAKV